ncbi:NmrA family NAD(P)-binding protein [Leuconostoc mesenteroides]
MKKIMVTGATGELGTKTIQHLLFSKQVPADDIAALVRRPEKATYLSKLGITLRKGGYDDVSQMTAAFQNVEKLLIISSPELDNMTRLQQQYNVVRAAYQAKVGHIYLISLAETQERLFGLEDVDMATEHMVRATNIPFTILKNAIYLDELKPNILTAIKTKELVSSTDSMSFNYVLRDDLALANATVLSEEGHENKIYYLTREHLISYPEIATILSEITDTEITHKALSDDGVTDYLLKHDVARENAEFVTLLQKSIREEKFATTSTAISELAGVKANNLKENLKSLLSDNL